MRATTPLAEGDARADRRALLLTGGAVLGVFAIGAAVQTAYAFGNPMSGPVLAVVLTRVAANLGAVVVMLGVLAVTGTHRTTSYGLVAVQGLAAAATGATVRVGLQLALGVYVDPPASLVVLELASGSVVACISAAIGIGTMLSRRALRDQMARAAHDALQIERALQALQHEEVRVRREVAEGLHGSVQQRLVLIVARLDRILEHVGDGQAPMPGADIALLREVREQVDTVRGSDVRAMSRLLYPDQLEVGMVPAVRSFMGRVPATVRTRLVVSDALRALDDPAAPRLTQSERLLAVRVVEEAVTNALRHGRATSVEVRLGTTSDVEQRDAAWVAGRAGAVTVAVADDGVGFDPAVERPRSGLARLRDRLRLVDGALDVVSSPGAGASVSAWVPVSAQVR